MNKLVILRVEVIIMKKDMIKIACSMMGGMVIGFVVGMVKERMMSDCSCDCKCIIDEM